MSTARRLIDPFDAAPPQNGGDVYGPPPPAKIVPNAQGSLIDPFDKASTPEPARNFDASTFNGAEPVAPITRDQLSAIGDAFTGKKTTEFPDMPEFTPEAIDAASGRQRNDPNRTTAMEAFFLAGSPKAYADIMVKHLEGATQTKDKFGNPIIEWKGQKYYANKPGASANDLIKLGTDVSVFAGPAKLAGMFKGLAMRAVSMAGGAGLTSIGQDVGAGMMGSDEGVDLGRAGMAAGFGGASEVAGPLIGAGKSRLFPTKFVVDGKPTELAASIVRSAGFEPGALDVGHWSKLQDAFNSLPSAAKSALKDVSEGASGDATRAVASGITNRSVGAFPKTQGQATGDFMQIANEQSMRAGALGGKAQGIVSNFDEKVQAPAIREAFQATQARLGGQPGAPKLAGEFEAGGAILDKLNSAERSAGGAVDDAYDAVRQASLAEGGDAIPRFSQKSIPTIGKTMQTAVRNLDVVLDPTLTPMAVKAMKDIGKFSVKGGKYPQAVTIVEAETMRRRLGAYVNAAKDAPEDFRAAVKVKAAFDQWMDNAIDNALVSGDPAIYQQLKNARSLRADYARKFQASGGDDEAGKVMEKLTSGNATNQEAINFIFGASEVGAKQGAVRTLDRMQKVFGTASEEMGLIKEAGFMRMIYGPKQNVRQATAPQEFAQGIVSRMNNALDGPGREIMERMYSPAELGQLKILRDEMKTLIVPKLGQNPSGTSAALSRIVQSAAGKLSFLAGGVKGAAASAAIKGAGNVRNASAAKEAVGGFQLPFAPRVEHIFSTLPAAIGANAPAYGNREP